ncbi:MAG: flavodoxin family protein [Deltaproteobacteria bacterium]|nr:flavodoxin family protein [Deltaproteobacteria bacterium]
MSKKIIGFMGSPRKNKNTDTLLQEVLRGAEDAGAETKLVRIGELNMRGCTGCYACKRKEKPQNRCVLNDDMAGLYKDIEEADAVVFSSPVYMCTITPELKMVIDRLFPYLTLDMGTLLPKGKKCGLVFTQNQLDAQLFKSHFDMLAYMLGLIGFETPEILVSVNTIGYDGDIGQLDASGLETVFQSKMQHHFLPTLLGSNLLE